ncbi:hypothetical protein NQ314_019750 [Rhamnusium bicolor]|uniref:Uncharacterized protein n=1 Tax=Rhamnusium bicolor TaxID=1586634 RepID=A0AAV8WPV0_9CUCU|nr:hypothetical protein NQ314_019750 [Rhamnusium bicolor]
MTNPGKTFSNVEVEVLLAGFGRTSYLKSRVKGQGGCARFWRVEKKISFWYKAHDQNAVVLLVSNNARFL